MSMGLGIFGLGLGSQQSGTSLPQLGTLGVGDWSAAEIARRAQGSGLMSLHTSGERQR